MTWPRYMRLPRCHTGVIPQRRCGPLGAAPSGRAGPRLFSASTTRKSHIGRAHVSLPGGVSLRQVKPVESAAARRARSPPKELLEVDGPLGKVSMFLSRAVTVEQDLQAGRAVVKIEDPKVRKQREMWGTTRAYLQNHVIGVSEGHIAILSLIGVGYRATVEDTAETVAPEYPGQQFVNLKLGYSHPIELGVPKGVKASTPQPTRILLEGVEREVIYQFAAKIRMWRKPEPYKGKGIFVDGETIKLKAKKIK